METFGYLLYLLAIILPGLGAGWLFGVWKKDDLLAVKVGYVLGLGLAVDTLVLFAGSSGLVIGSVGLFGVTLNMFYILIAIGAAFLLASAIVQKKSIALPHPSLYDWLVLMFMLVQTGMVFLFFTKYPIFPEYNSTDFRTHMEIVQTLLSGGSSLPGGLLYFGVHCQFALGVLLTGGSILDVVQKVGAILAILGTPIMFLAASRLLDSKEAGVIASLLYSLMASIWFGAIFDSGLYPNFFGLLASLVVLVLVADVARDGLRPGVLLAMVAAVGTLYLSHYSDVSVIPAVASVPVVLLLKGKLQKAQLVPIAIVGIPAGIGAVLFPSMVAALAGFVVQAGGTVTGGTYLSGVLSPVPILSNLATETYYDVGFVLLIAFAFIFAVRSPRERKPSELMLIVWFLSIIAVAPFNEGSWRLAFLGLVPLTLMAAGGIQTLLPKAKKGERRSPYRRARMGVVGLALILLLAGSWGATIVSDSTTDSQLVAQTQQNVYDSILWIGNNTNGGSILSVSDYRFLYTHVMIQRDSYYQFFSTPEQALPFARSHGSTYIVVTQLVTASIPPLPQLFPWNNFPMHSDANLTLIYSNPDVRIYKVV